MADLHPLFKVNLEMIPSDVYVNCIFNYIWAWESFTDFYPVGGIAYRGSQTSLSWDPCPTTVYIRNPRTYLYITDLVTFYISQNN